MIKAYIEKCNSNHQIGSLNNILGSIRRFLLWCEKEDYISFEKLFFAYLCQYDEPIQKGGDAVPDSDANKILEKMKEKGMSDDKWFCVYILTILLIETEYRIGSLCSLKTNCIKPAAKDDHFVISMGTKTSHGERSESIITKKTKELLFAAIERTESIRKNCPDNIKDFIFLYQLKGRGILRFSTARYRLYLQKVCEELALRKYSPGNFRDYHMTKAVEFGIKNNMSPQEIAVNTSHSHVDTTNHYLSLKLTEMLEATEGLVLGTDLIVDSHKHIVEVIPASLEKEENLVEYGCGICIEKKCIAKAETEVSCLVCDDFITTTKYEPFFQRRISELNTMINETKSEHDREDLQTIKELYVRYLIAIYETINGEDENRNE